MGYKFGQIMFGEASRALQAEHGSAAAYARRMAGPVENEALGPDEIGFIGERDSFYMATVTPEGWPYMQHRGGPRGFLQVLDSRTLAFDDLPGNKQYISVGNLATNDRVEIFLMDYPNQARLKVLGHASIEAAASPRAERRVRIAVTAFDWNCSQHIERRYTAGEWVRRDGE